MIIAVIVMGMCVSLLVMCDMGADPCSAMNYGISHKLGMSFGNYQLLSNIVLLIIVIIFDKKLIGTGTLGNMILVGYSADFSHGYGKKSAIYRHSLIWGLELLF